MRLIGIYLSPYVRRVAASLDILKLPFELDEVFVFGDRETVRRHNPLVRIPILVLDDGENLIESAAILDAIDHMVSEERRLTPSGGPLRRKVMQITAMALGAAEKAQWAFYEDRVRPREKVHIPWVEHNDDQVLGGFESLDLAARKIEGGGWIAGTPNISQADVTTAISYSFANLARADLELSKRFPKLAQFSERCEALPAFLNAPIPAGPKLNSLLCNPFVA